MQARSGGAGSKIFDPGFAAEVVTRTEEWAEAGEEADKKWNHEFGFIA